MGYLHEWIYLCELTPIRYLYLNVHYSKEGIFYAFIPIVYCPAHAGEQQRNGSNCQGWQFWTRRSPSLSGNFDTLTKLKLFQEKGIDLHNPPFSRYPASNNPDSLHEDIWIPRLDGLRKEQFCGLKSGGQWADWRAFGIFADGHLPSGRQEAGRRKVQREPSAIFQVLSLASQEGPIKPIMFSWAGQGRAGQSLHNTPPKAQTASDLHRHIAISLSISIPCIRRSLQLQRKIWNPLLMFWHIIILQRLAEKV